MRLRTFIICLVIVSIAAYIVSVFFGKPSNDRDWSPDQSVLPRAEISEDAVTIRNIRNFTYRSVFDYTIAYYDKTFDLEKLSSVWYIVEPFSSFRGAAHSFLSFGFENGDYVAISIEIRKQRGESFSAFKGLFWQYELMYVIADERDAVKLRTNYRNDLVYLYPIKTSREHMRSLFLDMLARANKLAEEPEFYNTIFNTCTTNIMRHVNTIVPGRIPLNPAVLFPAYSDHFAYKLGLIDTSLPLEEVRAKYLINERARKFADDPDFSRKIREEE